MKEFHGRASTRLDATPQAVFDFITDIDRLPDWNAAIEVVVERPPALAVGLEWTVKMHPPHAPSWQSVSRVDELRRDDYRFDRRMLPGPLRKRQLAREVSNSLAAIAKAVNTTESR